MADDSAKHPVSFGFSKKLETKKLEKSAASEGAFDHKVEQEFVLSLEGNEVNSTAPKVKQSEYVIPLIKKNKWRSDTTERFADVKNVNEKDDLDMQAAKEVIKESAKYNENWDERGKPDPNLSIPLLMQNKIPEGFETDDKLDVALRPDEPDEADYDKIPIEHFGMAMLRGMGFSEGAGIGKNAKVVTPLEATLRPKGLGLGADRRQATHESTNNDTKHIKEGEVLEMKKGAFCVVLDGKHKDLFGVVEGIDEDNARVVIKLTVGGFSVTMTQYSIKLISKKEYEKFSKYLNKGKADQFKMNDVIPQGTELNGDNIDTEQKSKHLKSNEERGNFTRKRKHESKDKKKSKHKPESSSTLKTSQSFAGTKGVAWLRPNLRVRVISKDYMKGKYYKEKMVVIDLITADNAVCKTDDGKVLEGLSRSMLETVIPKSDSSHVLLCGEEYKGQLAKILKKDKSKCMALVQLLKDRDIVLKVNFDEICEYIGNIDDEFDY